MNTKLSQTVSLLAVTGGLAFAQAASATTITGSVQFNPNGVVTKTDAATHLSVAKTLTIPGIGNAQNAGTGDLSGISGANTSFTFSTTTFQVTPHAINAETIHFSNDANTEHFTFVTSDIHFFTGGPNPNNLSFDAIGHLTGTGVIAYSSTPADFSGSFTLTGDVTDQHIAGGFSLSAPVATPDGGMTLSLLGAALTGAALLKRRFVA